MNRKNIINTLAAYSGAKSYLEIGIAGGRNFQEVNIQRKLGVDPAPQVNDPRVLRITSDDFFASNIEKFDIIFIDGLHEHSQVLRDIKNALMCLAEGGYIVCHDMNPQEEEHQVPTYSNQVIWNGDSWKALVEARATIPGIEVYTVDSDHGCAVISKKSNGVPLGKEVLQMLDWKSFCAHRREWLNLISVAAFLSKVQLVADLNTFIQDPSNPENNLKLAEDYDKISQYASAVSYYIRAAERSQDPEMQYSCLIRAATCFDKLGTRGLSVRGLLNRAMTILPKRPEAYFHLARWFEREQQVESWVNCYTTASVGLDVSDLDAAPLRIPVDYPGKWAILFEKAVSSWWVGLCDDSRDMFKELLTKHPLDTTHRTAVINNLNFMNQFVTKEIEHYDSSKYSRLRYQFTGWDQVQRNSAEAYQDMFVLLASGAKRNGTYLEIGAGNPTYGNNTWLLESQFGWTGISIDLDKSLVDEWPKHNRTGCIHANALEVDYAALLEKMPQTIDYLQVDIDPADVSLKALERVLTTSGKTFGVVTFEHDSYCQVTNSIQEKAAALLTKAGYVNIVKNVAPDSWRNYEDWWVHASYISSTSCIAELMHVVDRSDRTKRAETIFLA